MRLATLQAKKSRKKAQPGDKVTLAEFGLGKLGDDSAPIRVTYGNQAEYFLDNKCTKPAPISPDGPLTISGFCNQPVARPPYTFYGVALCLDDGSGKLVGWGASNPHDCLMKAATGEGITVGAAGDCMLLGSPAGVPWYVRGTCSVQSC